MEKGRNIKKVMECVWGGGGVERECVCVKMAY